MNNELLPIVQQKLEEHIKLCAKHGLFFKVTSTYRSIEDQNKLYQQGRTTGGNIVTNAKGGQSLHNWRVAYDIVPLIEGKIDWNNEAVFYAIGEFGKRVGLEWGGDWTKFKDMPHFQLTLGHTFQDFIDGKVDYKAFGVVAPVVPKTPPVVVVPREPVKVPVRESNKLFLAMQKAILDFQMSEGLMDFKNSPLKSVRFGSKTLAKSLRYYHQSD